MVKLSVIMPVYNTKQYLKEAIDSILLQSFWDFEFIILDDFSTDGSFEILKKYEKIDKRIKLFRNNKNMWISFTRNKLIELSNTDYIASQDSDDISETDRLKLEYNFLKNNEKYWAVSWNNIIINENSEIIGYRKYNNDIKNIILRKSPISNPSSMFRKSFFINVWWYDQELTCSEDYDLWIKFFIKWYLLKNLDTNLIKYRISKWQIKSKNLKETIKNTIQIQINGIKKWIKCRFSDRFYILLESILLLLPSPLILWLFKNLEYKKW